MNRKSFWVAISLCLALGFLGAHRFYLGYQRRGLLIIACWVVPPVAVLLVLYEFYWLVSKNGPFGRVCHACKSPHIQYEEGYISGGRWEHRNKDGSRDKRYKNNRRFETFTSLWTCQVCGAQTQFEHKPAVSPSKNTVVVSSELVGNITSA